MYKKMWFTVLLFTVFFSTTWSQTSKWAIGVHSTIDFLAGTDRMPTSEYMGFIRQKNSNQFNYTVGAELGYQLSKWLNIRSGLLYSNKDFMGICYCDICGGKISGPPTKLELRYLEVPLYVQGAIPFNEKHKLAINWRVGGNYGFLLNVDKESQSAFNSHLFSSILGLGIQKELSERLSVSAIFDMKVPINHMTTFGSHIPFKERVSLNNGLGLNLQYRL